MCTIIVFTSMFMHCPFLVELYILYILYIKMLQSNFLYVNEVIISCDMWDMLTFKALLRCGGKDYFQWLINGSWQKYLCNSCWDRLPHIFFDMYLIVVDSSWNVMTHSDAWEGEWRGKPANGVGSQCSSHYLRTWCIQHYYHWCAHLGCQ